MDTRTGVQRIKIVWLLICFVPALIAAGLMMSATRYGSAPLMAACVLLIAAGLSVPPLLSEPLRTKVAAAYVGVLGGSAMLGNLNDGLDALTGSPKPLIVAVSGACIWLVWAAAEWVFAGFKKAKSQP